MATNVEYLLMLLPLLAPAEILCSVTTSIAKDSYEENNKILFQFFFIIFIICLLASLCIRVLPVHSYLT